MFEQNGFERIKIRNSEEDILTMLILVVEILNLEIICHLVFGITPEADAPTVHLEFSNK